MTSTNPCRSRNCRNAPHIALAQSTSRMDWSRLELIVFGTDATSARGLVHRPGDDALHEIDLVRRGRTFALAADPLEGKVTWTIRHPGQ